MPIEFIAGDLFANVADAQAFAHGCNCEGSMGAGIAREFRRLYPAMYEEYRQRCKATPRQFNLGDAWLWKAEAQPWVFNLGTQERGWHGRATYDAIETALRRMRASADAGSVTTIAMPRIGAGFGGLSWKKVRAIIERVFGDWSGRLIVYGTFVAANAPPADDTGPAPAARQGGRRRRTKRSPSFQCRAVTIACTDLERSVRFYETVLGATALPQDVGTNRWYRLGKVEITLLPNAEHRSPADFPTHAMTMLWLEVDDLAVAAEHLAAHGVQVVDEGDGQYLQIADPDGLIIEVWEIER